MLQLDSRTVATTAPEERSRPGPAAATAAAGYSQQQLYPTAYLRCCCKQCTTAAAPTAAVMRSWGHPAQPGKKTGCSTTHGDPFEQKAENRSFSGRSDCHCHCGYASPQGTTSSINAIQRGHHPPAGWSGGDAPNTAGST